MNSTKRNIESTRNLTLQKSKVRAIDASEVRNLSLDIQLVGIIGLIISIILLINIIILIG
jgi:hypothetical protein